jgi:hypothetical protein
VLGVAFVCVAAAVRAEGEERSLTTQRDADLREGPAAYFDVVGRLSRGTTVQVGETRGFWHSARTVNISGWTPGSAFEKPKAGVDYLGLVEGEAGMVISSVDITAAAKGAFAARLSEKQRVDLAKADVLDRIKIDPGLVRAIQGDLPRHGERTLARLPRSTFANTVGLDGEAEALLGRVLASTIMTSGLVSNARLVGYVNAVAAVVGEKTERPCLPYRVAILDDPSINGFGLPGGYIFLSAGLVDRLRDEAELACVLGHEMAHISRFHGLREFKKRDVHRRADQVFSELEKSTNRSEEVSKVDEALAGIAEEAALKIMGGRSRADELEADLYGAAYAAAAGYQPAAAVDVLERIMGTGEERVDVYRHHPPIASRAADLKKGIAQYRLAGSDQVRPSRRLNEALREGR